jgi:uncharacterized protein YueI
MKTMLERTTTDEDIKELVSLIKNETAQLLVLKCLFTYPEYSQRIKMAKLNALNESRVNKYSNSYTSAFVLYRIDLAVKDIYSDMKSAFDILTARLKYAQPELLNSKPYIKIKEHVTHPPELSI